MVDPRKLHQHNRHLIVGGHNIEAHRYPYFCSMDRQNGVIVQGALIAPDIVLSAGHIALGGLGNITLKVGPYAVHQQEPFAETIPVASHALPSNWSEFMPTYFSDDFMIIKLSHKSTHKPVKINRNPSVPYYHQPLTIIGLGWLNASYLSPPNIVQETELLALDNANCSAAEDPIRHLSYSDKIKESMLCTMEPPNTVRDACAWDSGAPLIIKGAKPEEDVLVALGSTGIGCADPIFPGIQARVAYDFGLWWIRHQVCQLSVDPPADFECETINATTASLVIEQAISRPVVNPWAVSRDGPVLIVGCLFLIVAFILLGKDRTTSTRGKKSTNNEQATFRDQSQTAQYGSLDCD